MRSDYGSKVQLNYDAVYLWVANISTFVADDNTVIKEPIVMYTHAAISHVEDVFRDLYHSGQPALQIYHISECVLSLCERKYDITVKDGVTSSDLISIDYGRLSQFGSCWQPKQTAEDVVLTSPDGGHTHINQTERAFCPVDTYYDVFTTKLDNSTYTWHYNLTHLYQQRGDPPPAPAEYFDRVAADFATTLTDYGLNMSNRNAVGMAYLPEAKVLVRWQWIALPVLLQLATVVLFVSTAVYSRHVKVPIWKSLLLAICYHDIEDLQETRAVSLLSQMDKASGTASV